jgi:hypothetical protein
VVCELLGVYRMFQGFFDGKIYETFCMLILSEDKVTKKSDMDIVALFLS